MKKLIYSLSILILSGACIYLIAADHNDAPAVENTSTDIADLYVFESPENSDNLVFVATLSGLLSPSETQDASFDENIMAEFNIDTDGDTIENQVIQVIFEDNKVKAFGPVEIDDTGLESELQESADMVMADITEAGEAPHIGSNNGVKVFAGPRDDPFFFDLNQYLEIINGNASSFNNPGTDTFEGTNVLAVVVEVPKNRFNSNQLNVWLESKREK